ncbi:hypothetical protein GCK72_004232 [Caenorhabditis remanei]|uniref:EB domain-containing protein n=1 Tax=Caenorhabditis remanei TaxID=31234 RepID=A0A6A5HAR1_CAERE|nr:hypothetical protein GCK72_004232 [Caenorhabditis remanei]KAF1764285.1 hypothetical protein GCK72_004232 [Caenorhabditis remanei]
MFQIPLVLAAYGFEPPLECTPSPWNACHFPGQYCVNGQCRDVRELFADDGAPESAPESDQCHPECPHDYNCINGKCVRYVEESRGRVKKSWPECLHDFMCKYHYCLGGFCLTPPFL